MGKEVGAISGMPFTDRHKRVGAKKGEYSLKPPKTIIRQVDGGMWKGPPIIQSDKERQLIRWIKQERKKDQSAVVKSTRGAFVDAVVNAYKIGKGQK